MKENITKTANHLNNLRIKHQVCHNNGIYPFKNQDWKVLHENYENVTGLKVKLGENLRNNKALYCFDIDCKEQENQGEILFKYFLEKFPYLKNTYIEKTNESIKVAKFIIRENGKLIEK